jgi:vacuolar-type H+-ATPase subunit I/STV1
MGTYRDNTPNYNVNKVMKFSDFDKEIQKKETEDLKRGYIKNSDKHQMPGNKKLKYNELTGKMDDISMAEVEDKLKSLSSLKESMSDTSMEIIQKISKYLEDHPEVRFAQALFNLNVNEFEKDGSLIYRDIYNDSDKQILDRINKNM